MTEAPIAPLYPLPPVPQYAAPPSAWERDRLGVLSLIAGGFSILPIVPFLSIIGLVFGIVGVRDAKANGRPTGLSVAGIVVSVFSMVAYLLLFLLLLVFILALS